MSAKTDDCIKGGYFMALPSDSYMLLSVVNMKLRDTYSNLDILCDDLQQSREELCEKLASIGYKYDDEINQFV